MSCTNPWHEREDRQYYCVACGETADGSNTLGSVSVAAIYEALGVQPPADEVQKAVKYWDGALLATEARDLMGPAPAAWVALPDPLKDRIEPLPPEEAKKLWLDAWKGISDG